MRMRVRRPPSRRRRFCRPRRKASDGKLMAERVVPTIVALRLRLDEICRQELDSFREENGPFSKDQDEMLNAMMSPDDAKDRRSRLARELKGLPEKVDQEQMTTALRRLFHLQTAESAIASTKSA